VAPTVHENALVRRLRTIDATCPLVTKVHVEARKFAEEGYTIILIGHEGHEEVEGTTGEAPGSIVLVQTAADVVDVDVDDPDRVAYITQTTLSVDETTEIIARLRERFPNIVGPKNYLSLLVNRARMEGFVVFDFASRYAEAAMAIAKWHKEGKLKAREDIVEGIAQFPEALQKLFRGENFGKLVLKL